ncbi:VOC family protein [Glycomyces albus]
MTRPNLAGVHHIKVPVTDLPTSVEWYQRVFGLRLVWEFPDENGVIRGTGGTVPGLGGTMLALRENPKAAEGCKDFDPFGIAVEGPDDLRAWMAHLDELGIEHSPLIEASLGWLLVFNDPDGLEIHMYTWAEHGKDHSHRPGYGRRVPDAS